MSVVVMAKFPYRSAAVGLGAIPAVLVVTDTRVSAGGGTVRYRQLAPKDFRLAGNLVVGYTSSNLYATTEALFKKAEDPTTLKRKSIATHRDLRRLGEILKSEHDRYGGFSEVLAAIWERGHNEPAILELMPLDYLPRSRSGVVGIGPKGVLDRFQTLHTERSPSIVANPKAAAELACAELLADLSQAVEETGDPTVAAPFLVGIVRKDGIFAPTASLIREETGEIRGLTAEEADLALPKTASSTTKFEGEPRTAQQLLPGPEEPEQARNASLRLVLRDGDRYALVIAATLQGPEICWGFGRSIHPQLRLTLPQLSGGRQKTAEIDGAVRLAAISGISEFDSDYEPEPDTSVTNTLVVDKTALPAPWTAELWASPGSDEGMSRGHAALSTVAEIRSDWSQPELILVVRRLNAKARRALEHAVSRKNG